MQDDKDKRIKKAEAEMARTARRAPSTSEQSAYKSAKERLATNYSNQKEGSRTMNASDKNQIAATKRSSASENYVLSAAQEKQRMGRDIPLAATPDKQLATPLINRNK